jgi:hypothetical protein
VIDILDEIISDVPTYTIVNDFSAEELLEGKQE